MKLIKCSIFLLIFIFATSAQAATCDEIIKQFEDELSKSTGVCQTDADCGCFNGVSPKNVCGGVTDKKTSVELSKIEAQFHLENCQYQSNCAAWICEPRCLEGKCQK